MREVSWFIAMTFAVAAVSASLERVRRVRAATSFDLAALAQVIGRRGDRGDIEAMLGAMIDEAAGWESELVAVALDTSDANARRALVNEVLGDAERSLAWGARIPGVAARLAALGPSSVLFFGLAGGAFRVGEIVPLIAWAGAGVVASLAAGREAERIASQARRDADVWVELVLGAIDRRRGSTMASAVDRQKGDV
ncbi:MAG TPA: hypothetical protein VJT73_15280 [Polyangiaceae bacterium]|nr:hypothetical protein [Polyangiaceae bacterium]